MPSRIGGAPAGTVGSTIPPGRYAIDLDARYNAQFLKWLEANRGAVKVTHEQTSRPMTAYEFTLSRATPWPPSLAWPTLLGEGQHAPNVTPTSDPDYVVPGSDLAAEFEHQLLNAPGELGTIVKLAALTVGAFIIFKLIDDVKR